MHSLNLAVVAVIGVFTAISQCDSIGSYRDGNSMDPETDPNTHLQASHPATERNYNTPHMRCKSIQPQHSLDIDYILGPWFASEIIMHSADVPGVYNYNSCVIINIDDYTDQMRSSIFRRPSQSSHQYRTGDQADQGHFSNANHRNSGNGNSNSGNDNLYTKYLRLVWSENDDNLEYTLNYTTYSPGLWTNVGEQRGSIVALNQYTQFTGTVQVLKVVNDHMVLTFCGTSPQSSIYTIVLSRIRDDLSSEKLASIHSMLWTRGLSTDSIRKVCVTSGAAAVTSSLLMLLGIYGLVGTVL